MEIGDILEPLYQHSGCSFCEEKEVIWGNGVYKCGFSGTWQGKMILVRTICNNYNKPKPIDEILTIYEV